MYIEIFETEKMLILISQWFLNEHRYLIFLQLKQPCSQYVPRCNSGFPFFAEVMMMKCQMYVLILLVNMLLQRQQMVRSRSTTCLAHSRAAAFVIPYSGIRTRRVNSRNHLLRHSLHRNVCKLLKYSMKKAEASQWS